MRFILYALPPAQLGRSTVAAAAAVGTLFSSDVGRWLSLFIALISFGGASVVVLGGARIYYSMAKDGAFFSGDDAASSPLEDAGHQPRLAMRMGVRADPERPLRSALYLLHLHDDPDLCDDRGRRPGAASNSAGSAAALPLLRLSVASDRLHARRRSVRAHDAIHQAARIARGARRSLCWAYRSIYIGIGARRASIETEQVAP